MNPFPRRGEPASVRIDPRLVPTAAERGLLLDAFARGLALDECILELGDVYRAGGRHTLQLPADPAAEVLLVEPPRLRPGGITEIVSYVRARNREVRQVTVRGSTIEEDLTYVLRPHRRPEGL